MNHWTDDALFYHLYPLGALGAPWTNSQDAVVPRIRDLAGWIEPAARVGANALLLGPLWESGTHGYDTHDYSTLDRRLGTNDDLRSALRVWKERGFRLVFDGVFHHCGRGFFAFEDLRARGQESAYRDWFSGVDFSRRSPCGDAFDYHGWNGHHSLVKFNLSNESVRAHLLNAVASWIDDYDLDGLRLDAADVIDKDFLRELAAFCRLKKPDFWLMGEVIHGDYNEWSPGAGLDSVTNYELFKGLWSSHNDGNYFEAAWSLNRQFGVGGVYRGQNLTIFGDNHDVDRLGSTLTEAGHLYPHAILTATVPGVPTIYYGTEAGIPGRKSATGDEALRPALRPQDLDALPHQPLRELWRRLSDLRRDQAALRTGTYLQASVSARQFAFWRLPQGQGRPVLVAVNSDAEPAAWSADLPVGSPEGRWLDLLNPGAFLEAKNGRIDGTLWPHWGSILIPAV